jgi:hypothetical protein
MQAKDIIWSDTEKQIAKEAFDRAYQKEIKTLIELVRQKNNEITTIEDLWHLNDFLSARRHEIDGKYDYQYSILIFVFAGLVKDGWLKIDELKGLSSDKIGKIVALTKM